MKLPSRSWFLTAALLSGFLSACEDDPPQTEQENSSAEMPAMPKAPAASASAAQAEKPKHKEFTAVDKEKLGTLPDDVGIAVGTRAPDFELTSADGEKLKLESLHKENPVLLVFYRGGWCPYCNFQIRSLTKAHDEFEKRDVQVVAVSVDKPSSAKETQATYEIPFPVLSDPELEAHQAFHVTNELDAEEVKRLEGFGIDLGGHSGKEHNTIAIPSVFLIDQEGIVRWAHADSDYKVRPTVEQLLSALDSAGFKPEPAEDKEDADAPSEKPKNE